MAKIGVRSDVPIAIGIGTSRQPGLLLLQWGAMCQDAAAETHGVRLSDYLCLSDYYFIRQLADKEEKPDTLSQLQEKCSGRRQRRQRLKNGRQVNNYQLFLLNLLNH